jgi:hypothetical protein
MSVRRAAGLLSVTGDTREVERRAGRKNAFRERKDMVVTWQGMS